MALATTCPKCKTSFKVVPDQLKLRRGLVRCGVCQHVFSGIDYLRYVSDPRPSPTPTVVQPPADEAGADLKTAFFLPDTVVDDGSARARPAPEPSGQADARVTAEAEAEAEAEADAGAPVAADDAHGSLREGAGAEPDAPPGESAEAAFDEAEFGETTQADAVRAPESDMSALHADASLATEAIVAERAIDTDAFDERETFAPRSRAAADDAPLAGAFAARPVATARRLSSRTLWIATASLVVLLALQLLLGARDLLAARQPGLRPLLESLSAPLGLEVELPRLPSQVTIESFELIADKHPGVYTLNAVLRNRAPHPVQWPAIELTLTDSVGAVLVRKVLEPSEFLAAQALPRGFAGQTEKPVRLRIAVRDIAPSGYKAILFYP